MSRAVMLCSELHILNVEHQFQKLTRLYRTIHYLARFESVQGFTSLADDIKQI